MKILCTLSGGSDSAYAALVAKKRWPDAEFHSIFVDYDQPEVEAENRASLRVHHKLGFPSCSWRSVSLLRMYQFKRSKDNMASIYIPLRNLVIASIAAARAEDIGASIIVVGNKSQHRVEGEILGYDGNRDFYQSLARVIRSIQTGSNRIDIIPTLAEMGRKLTREDVYFGLWSEGFTYADTFSCWFPEGRDECGNCKNCKEKLAIKERWAEVMLS